jgi:hypothetical protein
MEHAFVKQDGSGNFVKDNHVYMNAITKGNIKIYLRICN